MQGNLESKFATHGTEPKEVRERAGEIRKTYKKLKLKKQLMFVRSYKYCALF